MFNEIELDKSASIHLYLQLYNQIRDFIKEGRLTADTKLPPIRKLAQKLEVNNVTVVKAYNLLEEEKLVYKKVGSGTFVVPQPGGDLLTEESQLDEEVYIDEAAKFTGEGEINFATAAPTPDLFPIRPFKRLMNKVIERDKGYAFGYQKSQGYLPLRESIIDYLKKKGISSRVKEIQIVSGAQQGIDILAKTFLDYGDTVFVERPTYPGAISVFESRQASIEEIPIIEDGIDISILEDKIKTANPKFLYLMPNFQNPTGFSYSKQKKEQIIKLANKYDLLIIEDDCLSDLSYQEGESSSLKALDTEGKVIYIKSFSKIFMPGLRLAFLLLPDRYFNDILLAKYMSDIFTDGLIQRVLDLYFREEVWEKQLRKIKETYQKRYETMISALEDYLPRDVKFTIPEGGLNIWLGLPENLSAEKIQNQVLKEKVKITPGNFFYTTNPPENKLRLSIASVNKDQIKIGIKRLASVIKENLTGNSRGRFDDSMMPLV